MLLLSSFFQATGLIVGLALTAGCGDSSEPVDDEQGSGTHTQSSGGTAGNDPNSATGGDANSASGGAGENSGLPPNLFTEQIRFGKGLCLPRQLPSDAAGMIPCELVEVRPDASPCEDRSRLNLSPSVSQAVLKETEKSGYCGGDTTLDCAESYFPCGIAQLEGALRDRCIEHAADASDTTVFTSPGFCYIDDPASPLVEQCDATEKRQLRFVGAEPPSSSSLVYLVCGGE